MNTFKTWILLSLCIATTLFTAACSTQTPQNNSDVSVPPSSVVSDVPATPGNKTEIPNPFVEYDDINQAFEAAGFPMQLPEEIPLDSCIIRVMQGKMIDVVYTLDENKISIRKGLAGEDISGDYNTYEDVQSVSQNGQTITLKGDGEMVYVATWQSYENSYCIRASQGLLKEDILLLVGQVA